MFAVGDKRELILVVRVPRQRWHHVMCFGRKRHYRRDGTCRHTDEVLSMAKAEHRHLLKVRPWGGKA